jgi:hypothetical protein
MEKKEELKTKEEEEKIAEDDELPEALDPGLYVTRRRD